MEITEAVLNLYEGNILEAQDNLEIEIDNELEFLIEVWTELKEEPSRILGSNIELGIEGLKELIEELKENERILKNIRNLKKREMLNNEK
jgi:hypothetical protein